MVRVIQLFLLIFLTTAAFNPAATATPSGKGPCSLELPPQYYEDKTGSLSINDILAGDRKILFRPSPGKTPNFGYTTSVYWLKFTIRNSGEDNRDCYLTIPYSLIDDIRLYLPQGSNDYVEKKSGRLYPRESQDYNNRHFNFRVNLPPKAREVCYLRVMSKDSLPVPLELWSHSSFIREDRSDQFLMGCYYGIILIIILYNLFIMLTIRDINYLYYLLCLISMHLLFQMGINGLSRQLFGTDSIWWSRESIAFFFSLGCLFLIKFSQNFLNTRKTNPRLHLVLTIVMGWAGLEALISLFLDYHWAIQSAVLMGQFCGATVWFSGFISLIKGNRAARFFLLAWTSLIFSGILYSLKVWGLIPSNIVTEYAWQVGSVIQAVLLGIALGDNINILRRDMFNAQTAALEKEKAAREAQERFSETLEKLVEERTNDLNVALQELRNRERRIQNELDLASDIQQGILPPTPLSFNGINIVAHYNSFEKIGGDFYDIFPMKGGHLCVLLADASGHGIPAAFVTALAKISFSEATQQYLFPRDILKQANEQLIKVVKTQEYLTVFLVVISPSYEVFYSNASHQRAFVLRKRSGDVEEWDTDGLFVGAVLEANERYEDKQDFLDFGDRVILYTDGLIEARSSSGEEFGLSRLKDLLRETGGLPIEQARESIVEGWRGFISESNLRDDVSFLLLEVDPSYRELLEYKNRGLEELFQNHIDEAIRNLSEALKIDNRDAKVHHLLGKCYFREKNYGESIEHINAYLAQNQEDADAWHMLAACQFNIRDFSAALTSAQKACSIRQNFNKALLIWGLSLKKLDRFQESKSIWAQILRTEPDNSVAAAEMLMLEQHKPAGDNPENTTKGNGIQ